MKILCNTEAQSDFDLLSSLAGTDTWIKVHPNAGTNETEYIQVLYVFDSGSANVLTVASECIDGGYLEEPDEAFTLADVFEMDEYYDLTEIKVVRPIETLQTWEIQSALEFAGYNKE